MPLSSRELNPCGIEFIFGYMNIFQNRCGKGSWDPPLNPLTLHILNAMIVDGLVTQCWIGISDTWKWVEILPVEDMNSPLWWRHQIIAFSAYWPFVRGIHRPPVNSPNKGQWRGALMYSSICAWINGWVNNREAAIWDAIAPIMTSL